MAAGTVFTKESMARWLEENARNELGQRTFGTLYGGLSLAGQQGIADLESEYNQSMLEAYSQASKNRSAIAGSNLGQGYKDIAFDETEQALNEAYETYVKNFLSNKAQVESGVESARNEVNKSLAQEGEMMSRYANAHLDYLQDVYNKWQNEELGFDLSKDMAWSKFLTQETDDEGNPVEGSYLLKSRDEIMESLIDQEGYLTSAGIDFFDQMENDLSNRGYYSLTDFLSSNKDYEDVLDWATNVSQFSYGDTGASLFRTASGRTKDDQVYKFIENRFGMESGEMEKHFEKLKSIGEQISSAIDKNARTKTVKNLSKEYVDEYKRLAEQMGVKDFDMFLAEQGTSYEDLIEGLENNNYRNFWDDFNLLSYLSLVGDNIAFWDNNHPSSKDTLWRQQENARTNDVQTARDAFNKSIEYLLNYSKR